MKIALSFCFVVLTCILAGFFLGLLERQATMNGVENLKSIGKVILEYKSETQSYPPGYTVAELIREIHFNDDKLKSFSMMDLHSCIYLKGKLESGTDCIILWRSGIKRNYFFGEKYYLEFRLFEDGHVSTEKVYF